MVEWKLSQIAILLHSFVLMSFNVTEKEWIFQFFRKCQRKWFKST